MTKKRPSKTQRVANSGKQTGKVPPKNTVKTPARKSDTAPMGDGKPEIVVILVKDHFDSKGNHPHGIMNTFGNMHVSVGFTTKKSKGKGSKNYPLDVDPLGTGKKSLMRRQGTVAPQIEYKAPRKGKMTTKDYERAKVYADRAEQKHRDKNDKKK